MSEAKKQQPINKKQQKSAKQTSKNPQADWKKYEFPPTHMQHEDEDPYIHLVETQFENILREKIANMEKVATSQSAEADQKYWRKKLNNIQYKKNAIKNQSRICR